MQPLRAATAVPGALALILLACLLVGRQGAAHAHVDLIGSAPESGATVSSSTGRVVLEFAAVLSGLGNDVVVRDVAGRDITSGPTQAAGNLLQTPIDIVTTGRHTIDYRFVGPDGHVATGHLWFTVAADSPHSAATALLAVARPPDAELDARPPAEASPTPGTTTETTVWLLPLVCLIGGLLLVNRRSVARRQPRRVSDDSLGPWQPPGS